MAAIGELKQNHSSSGADPVSVDSSTECQRSENQTGWDCGLKTVKIQQQNLSGGPQANAQCS